MAVRCKLVHQRVLRLRRAGPDSRFNPNYNKQTNHPDIVEFNFENILNLIGFLVGFAIGTISYTGFRNTDSPTLFRLSVAFFLIGAGFFVVWLGFILENLVYKNGEIDRNIRTAGIAAQTGGYFLIAFSHGIKSFLPKSRYLRSVGILPIFLISTIHIEHLLRSVSFILLTYAAIETAMSYFSNRKKGAVLVGLGLGMLAFGEFVGWYSLVFPGPVLYNVAISLKIVGLICLFIPVGRISLSKLRIKESDQ